MGYEIFAVILGLAILAGFLLAVARHEFDNEAPKYEMLGLSAPAHPRRLAAGRLGPTDRILRLGVLGAVFMWAAQLGWLQPSGLLLAAAGLYLSATGLSGRDPLLAWIARRRGERDRASQK